MLHIGMVLYNRIVSIPTIYIMTKPDSETREFFRKIKKAVIYSLIDTIIVGGIAFFSSMIAIGYDDLLVNIKIAFISSVVTAGLAFFTEMKSSVSVILDKEHDDKDDTKT